MTMTQTTDERRWTFRAFQEAPEPGAVRRSPEATAREQLRAMLEAEGYAIDYSSLRQEGAVDIVRDSSPQAYHEAKDGEKADGVIITWSATGSPLNDPTKTSPLAEVVEHGNDFVSVRVPEQATIFGGTIRVRHHLDTENVLVEVQRHDRSGMGYLVHSAITKGEIEVALLADSAWLTVRPAPDGEDDEA